MERPITTTSNLLTAPDGTRLDVLYARQKAARATLIVYPCIGGTTRMYEIPYTEFARREVSVLEFHPPAHGYSTGQMSMSRALQLFEWVLDHLGIDNSIYMVGHSAGANALLQFQSRIQRYSPVWSFYVEPVFDFSQSAHYMYRHGHQDQLMHAISKWVTNSAILRQLLITPDWLNRDYWMKNQLRERIDEISRGILLGEFLEDFYLRDNDVSSELEDHRNATVYISNFDDWFDPMRIQSIAYAANVTNKVVAQAMDHFFLGAWPMAWSDIIAKIDSSRSV